MTTDTPRTDACPHCGAEEISAGEFECGSLEGEYRSERCRWRESENKLKAEVTSLARQLERELTHSLENQVKAQAEVKEIRAALGDDGRRTHKEILELATKASQWREWKKKYIDLKNAHMAEGQDPAGTIWEHADKLQKELNASKAEVKIFRKEIIFREAMDNVAQEVWDEMKAKVERLTELLSLEEKQHEETRKLCAKILNSTRKTPSLEWHRKNRKVLLK